MITVFPHSWFFSSLNAHALVVNKHHHVLRNWQRQSYSRLGMQARRTDRIVSMEGVPKFMVARAQSEDTMVTAWIRTWMWTVRGREWRGACGLIEYLPLGSRYHAGCGRLEHPLAGYITSSSFFPLFRLLLEFFLHLRSLTEGRPTPLARTIAKSGYHLLGP